MELIGRNSGFLLVEAIVEAGKTQEVLINVNHITSITPDGDNPQYATIHTYNGEDYETIELFNDVIDKLIFG